MSVTLQSEIRIRELNNKLSETLISKGVKTSSNETTASLINKVADIVQNDGTLTALIDRTITEFTFPEGVTSIPYGFFYGCEQLVTVQLPKSITSIGAYAFYGCSSLKNIDISNVTNIGDSAFQNCTSITELVLSDGVNTLATSVFAYCNNLAKINIPKNLTLINSWVFRNTKITEVILPHGCTYANLYSLGDMHSLTTLHIPNTLTSGRLDWLVNSCTNLEFVTIEDGFDYTISNTNGLNLSVSTKYSVETIVEWLNALADRNDKTTGCLNIGATNLKKLTAEQIAIATVKNWTLV